MSKQVKSTPHDEAWTVLRLLQWTTDFFRKKGSESPRLDAEVLLAHVLDCTRVELYTGYGSEPDEKQRERFRELVRRRGAGTPVAYLVGYREFYSLRFKVSPAVLIPRPETEQLVIESLDFVKERSCGELGRPLRIVDVCTGSGAIAIAIARHLRPSNSIATELTAIDISGESIVIANENARQLAVSDQVSFLQGDLLEPLPKAQTIDLVVSNPPYVSEAEFEELPESVRNHEPRIALVAGPKGTEVIERLIVQARERLASGGKLILEISPMIAEACVQLIRSDRQFSEPRLVKDLSGLWRVISAVRTSVDPSTPTP